MAKDFLQTLLNNIPEPVFVKDENRRIIFVNQAVLDFLGCAEGDILGKATIMNASPEQGARLLEADQKAYRNGYAESEETIKNSSGQLCSFRIKKRAFTDEDGNKYLLGLMSDVSASKKEEDILRRVYQISSDKNLSLEDRIHTILELAISYYGLDMGIVSHIEGDSYEILYVAGTGQCPIQGTSFPYKDTFCALTYQASNVQAFFNVGQSELATHPCYHQFQMNSYIGVPLYVDGERYGTVNFSSLQPREEPFSEAEKSFIRMISQWIGHEIGNSRYLKKIKDSEEELRRSNKELDQYASIVSHDLQQPLRAIDGFLELLKQGAADKLDDQARAYIKSAHDASHYLSVVIDELLEYARCAKSEKEPELIDLNDVMDNVVQVLSLSLDEKDADIHYGRLPEIMHDRNQVERLLTNLVGNAVKYAGDRSPVIEVGAKEQGDDWLIWVKDNGIGIAENHREHVFDMFYRVGEKEEASGTGIGLAICKKIVESRGGRIWVESEPDQGSTFFFTVLRQEP